MHLLDFVYGAATCLLHLKRYGSLPAGADAVREVIVPGKPCLGFGHNRVRGGYTRPLTWRQQKPFGPAAFQFPILGPDLNQIRLELKRISPLTSVCALGVK